jgi:ABC-type branched-subunit amino acid transport system ATPase component
MEGTPDNLLVAEKVRKEFGGLVATDDVDFTIPRGSIVALIGPNGAGKTTFFNQITGVYEPTSGSIIFDGIEVVGKPPHAIVELGVGRTFQNIRLFAQMTASGRRASSAARSSRTAGCRGATRSTPARSLTVISAASRSLARSRPIRSSFFSTSRPLA